jgi:hypothetical protein
MIAHNNKYLETTDAKAVTHFRNSGILEIDEITDDNEKSRLVSDITKLLGVNIDSSIFAFTVMDSGTIELEDSLEYSRGFVLIYGSNRNGELESRIRKLRSSYEKVGKNVMTPAVKEGMASFEWRSEI